MRSSKSTVLFLCTGNYYRSRYAEEFFNHHAAARSLGVRAQSKGLARDLSALGNVGPISPYALERLQRRGVTAIGRHRFPVAVEAADFETHTRVIVLSRAEHEPMVAALFPRHVRSTIIEYWDIEDDHLESPETALTRLERRLIDLLDEWAD